MTSAGARTTTESHPIPKLVRLRVMKKVLWMRQVWSGIPEGLHPAAIQHEEVDRILSDPQSAAREEASFFANDAAALQLDVDIDAAERELALEPRWKRLIDALEIGEREQRFLLTAVAVAMEPALGRTYAYLHDQPEMAQPTPWLADTLFQGGSPAAVLDPQLALHAWGLVRRASDVLPLQEPYRGWMADPAIVAWLSGAAAGDLPPGCVLYEPDEFRSLPVLYPGEAARMEQFLALRGGGSHRALEAELVGPAGSGRFTLAGQVAARSELSLLAVAAEPLLEGLSEPEQQNRVLQAVRASVLRNALLYWDEGDGGTPGARKLLRGRAGAYIAGRTATLPGAPAEEALIRTIELPPLPRSARECLWKLFSSAPLPWQVRDWVLTPGEIARLVDVAGAGDEAIQQVCRRPVDSLNLLIRLPLPFEPEELILAKSIQEQLEDFERQVRLRWDVYEDWGFDRLVPNGRGIVALFAGPSGTGKTMAAQVMARRLGLELFRLDPAQVVNKYIGETEKRLKSIFDEGDRAHFMLLIDECEGMFGQRFNSKDAHDRYANLEIDYLLQRLERFQGVAVLATNRKTDMDSAFLRRIRFVIDFLPPGPLERVELWKSAIPEKSPQGENLRGKIDWQALGERAPLTGAEIKLAALNAAFLACNDRITIGMNHLVRAIRRELAKKGQTLRGLEQMENAE